VCNFAEKFSSFCGMKVSQHGHRVGAQLLHVREREAEMYRARDAGKKRNP
jgi:hypothetical protein